MKIKHLFIGIALAANLFAATAQEVKKTYFVSKPGTLISMMTEEEANQVTHLTLTGKINAVDFKHLRDEFKNLQVLDIANASISMYSGKEGTYPDKFYIYMPNFVPAYAFCKMENGIAKGTPTLKKVVLSEKIKNIVPLGASDEYRLKNRWDNFAFIEGEPLEAKIEVGALSTLESEIQKAGLQPKEINFLTIEGKLDAADFKLIRDYMPNLVAVDIEKTNATAIPDFTFSQKKYLLRVRLPHGLKSIGQRAFSNCGRLCGTVELPESITAIEYGAFMGCDRLRYVVAKGDKITTIGDNLFGEGKNKLIYKR